MPSGGVHPIKATPKPSATAFHNLTTLLADDRANRGSFQPEGFSFTALGVPYNHTGNTLALHKSDGTRIIALWNEQQLWDPDTQTATEVKHIR
jgi:hypothetical protein